jgi:hypothetical protein
MLGCLILCASCIALHIGTEAIVLFRSDGSYTGKLIFPVDQFADQGKPVFPLCFKQPTDMAAHTGIQVLPFFKQRPELVFPKGTLIVKSRG